MKTSNKEEARNLRKRAEEIFKNKTKSNVPLSEFDTMKLIHELEVHQIELDMQNEELLNAKIEAIEAKEKYVELYDFAPSGHFSLSTEGQILECNHAGAKLFGKNRSELIKRKFVLFVSNSSKIVFKDFLEIVCQSKTKEESEVRLMSDKNETCVVLLSGLFVEKSNTAY